MNDLRKAAEALMNHWDAGEYKNCTGYMAGYIRALRQALDLETAIERGTKAWADVPDATEWVEELRGNVDKVDMLEKRVYKSDKSIQEEKNT